MITRQALTIGQFSHLLGHFGPALLRPRHCGRPDDEDQQVGFIGGFQIPNVIDAINAFTLGARSVNPKAEMHVIFDNTWSDPGKEAASTNALADQGVDVVTMIVDSPITVVQTAEQRGIYSVVLLFDKRDKNTRRRAGSAALASPGAAFLRAKYRRLKKAQWKSNPKNLLGDLNTDMVTLAPWGPRSPGRRQDRGRGKDRGF